MGIRGCRGVQVMLVALSAGLALALTACGSTTSVVVPTPTHTHGAVYTNAAYHFSVAYPDGWSCSFLEGAKADGQPGTGINCPTQGTPSPQDTPAPGTLYPVTVTLVLGGTGGPQTSQTSHVSVVILDLRNPQGVDKKVVTALTATMQGRAKDASLHTVQLGGHVAYASAPLRQDLPNQGGSATHVDYYIEATKVEYHISTDVISIEGVDSQVTQILDGFTLS
ncbi:MAG TPA: hypothetical protein VF807_15275 [Ktedonobacterales bacterium]